MIKSGISVRPLLKKERSKTLDRLKIRRKTIFIKPCTYLNPFSVSPKASPEFSFMKLTQTMPKLRASSLLRTLPIGFAKRAQRSLSRRACEPTELHPPRILKNFMPNATKQTSNRWIVIRVTREVHAKLIAISTSKVQTYDSILRTVLKMNPNIVSRKDASHDHPRKTKRT